jgi:hypothetical protein
MKRVVYFFVVAAMLAGCATTSPQSRDELKSFAKAHTTAMIYESYTSRRRFEDVVASLELKWNECYGISKTTTRSENGVRTSQYRDTFHPHFVKVNGFLVEMTLQMTTEGMVMLSKVPPGGDYIVALDVERLLGGKTRLTWHSAAWGWKDQWEVNKQWSDGKEAACL